MTLSAQEAHQSAQPGDCTIGWKVDPEQRRELLLQFPPRYPQPVADHVTLSTKVAADSGLPGDNLGEIVGRADDGRGVEALVVRIGGTTDRPDGSTYHITWSLAEGRQARESNDVIGSCGWEDFDLPEPVMLKPARLK